MASAPARLPPTTLAAFDGMLAQAPAHERWELIRGRVARMMVGARWEHNRVINNLGYELRRRLDERNSPCRVFLETFRLRSDAAQSSLLPDVIVQCVPLAPGAITLDQPAVIFEVLSDSTSQRDRDEKFAVYRSLASLRHYVLVALGNLHIEVFSRDEDEFAAARLVEGLDADLTLASLDLSIPLRSVYRDVIG